MKDKLITIICAILVAGTFGCEGFLDTKPADEISDELISKDVAKLEMVLMNAYQDLYGGEGFGYRGLIGMQLYLDLRGSDVVSVDVGTGWDYQYIYQYNATVTEASGAASYFWNYFYQEIRQLNTVLKYIDDAPGSDDVRQRVKGEALALRAYCYFCLAQLYQQTYVGNEELKNVILRTEPVDPADVNMKRASSRDVYDLIRADLSGAINLLEPAGGSRSMHINRNIAQAMLAKVSMVTNEWTVAETMASQSRQGFGIMEATDYLKGFSLNPYMNDENNPEWMWYLPQTVTTSVGDATPMASWGNRNRSSIKWETDMVFANEELLALYEPGDIRFSQFWQRNDRVNPATGENYWTSNKYSEFFNGPFTSSNSMSAGGRKINPDYTGTEPGAEEIFNMLSDNAIPATYIGQLNLIRAADLLLIEAEAKARQQGKEGQALALLNELRVKRNASTLTGLTGTALVDEIVRERRRELYGEGTCLFDILRTKQGLVRSTAHSTRVNFPAGDYRFITQIPSGEFTYNKALDINLDQNPVSGTAIPANMTTGK